MNSVFSFFDYFMDKEINPTNEQLNKFINKYINSLDLTVPPFVLYDVKKELINQYNNGERSTDIYLKILDPVMLYVDRTQLVKDLNNLINKKYAMKSDDTKRIVKDTAKSKSKEWNVSHIDTDFNQKNIKQFSDLEKTMLRYNDFLIGLVGAEGLDKEKTIKLLNLKESDFIAFNMTESYSGNILEGRRDLPDNFKAKKILYDASTEHTVKETNKEINMRSRIIMLVVATIQDLLDKYVARKGLQKNDFMIMFKGGNILRLFIDLHSNNFNIDVEAIIKKHYGNYIKISDNDFQIIYNQCLDNDHIKKYYYEVMFLSYALLDYITYYLRKYKDSYFDQFRLNSFYFRKFQIELLNKLFAGLDKAKNDYGQIIGEYKLLPYIITVDDDNVDIIIDEKGNALSMFDPSIKHIMDNLKIFEQEELIVNKTAKRTNIFISQLKETYPSGKTVLANIVTKSSNLLKKYINYDKDNANLYINEYFITKRQNQYGQFYASYNDSIEFRNEISGLYNKFGLNRIKQNYAIILTKNNNGVDEYYKLNVPSEIIDLSIAHPASHKKIDSNKIQQVSIDVGNDYDEKNDFNFITYNIDGLFRDLMTILYEEVSFPWEDMKYEKRLKRLFILSIIDLFNNEKSENVYQIKQQLQNIMISIKNKSFEPSNYTQLESYLLFELVQISDKYFNMNTIDSNKYTNTFIDELNVVILILDESIKSIQNNLKYDLKTKRVFRESALI